MNRTVRANWFAEMIQYANPLWGISHRIQISHLSEYIYIDLFYNLNNTFIIIMSKMILFVACSKVKRDIQQCPNIILDEYSILKIQFSKIRFTWNSIFCQWLKPDKISVKVRNHCIVYNSNLFGKSSCWTLGFTLIWKIAICHYNAISF